MFRKQSGIVISLEDVYFLDEEPIALDPTLPTRSIRTDADGPKRVVAIGEALWHGAPTTVGVAGPAHGSHIVATQDGDVHQSPI